MKFISDNGKEYENEKLARKADEEFAAAKLKAEIEEKEKKNSISKRKKELSDNIKKASEDVDLAEAEYKEIKDKAKSIIKEANLKAEEILKEALLKVDRAKESRMNAIKAFNDEFGAYTTTYTGAQAINEYNKFTKEMNKVFQDFWSFLL